MILKFCGMRKEADLVLAEKLGARMCGFIFHPRSPRSISAEEAGRLRSGSLERVGVFLENDTDRIASMARIARLDWIQLHGSQDQDCARALGPERVIRVLWPARYASCSGLLHAATQYADSCAMFLLDAGDSGGGSGRTISWSKLRNLTLPRPWLLAGGISACNIEEALARCQPSGIDVNSGVEESPGCKSAALMRIFADKFRHAAER